MKHLIARLFDKWKPSQSDVISITPTQERATQEFIMLNTGELVPITRSQINTAIDSTNFTV